MSSLQREMEELFSEGQMDAMKAKTSYFHDSSYFSITAVAYLLLTVVLPLAPLLLLYAISTKP